MSTITSMPIPMIQENAQLTPTKLKLSYIYTGSYSAVTVSLYGINKKGHNLIATCVIPYPSLGKYASDIFVGIPANGYEYPFICFTYVPVAGFKFVGTPELILEAREYPDTIVDTDIYTPVVLI